MITFFFDRTFGARRVANALRELGLNIIVHCDHFQHDTPDQDWIPVVAERGWVVLTQDRNIRHRPMEREAVRTSGLRMFAFTQNNIPWQETVQIIRIALDDIIRISTDQAPPFIGQIQKSGKVVLLETFEGQPPDPS